MAYKGKRKTEEKTVVKSLGLGEYRVVGFPARVNVENGRIVRIRPLHHDCCEFL